MRNFYFLYLFLLTICISCSSNEQTLFIGTYTDGESEGIYKMEFDEETGVLSNKQLMASEVNPSFLAFGPNKGILYAVNETNNYDNSNSGSVVSFKILNTGQLELINKVSSEGAHPCHITVDETGNILAVSNYTGGTVAILNSSSGLLRDASQIMNHNSSVEKSHAHSALFSGNYLYVADLGRNAVYRYLNNEGLFEIDSHSLIPFEENSGPRHFILSNNAQNLYVINEYANSISTATKDGANFKLLEHVSTLPESFDSESFCADIHFSKNERFVYGSNRGENTIAVFERDLETGKLQRIQNADVKGNWPRNFTISPNGKFLLVANQRSNNISTFRIDEKAGTLNFVSSLDFPSPVCLLF